MNLFVAALVCLVALGVTSAAPNFKKSALADKTEDDLLDMLLEKLEVKNNKGRVDSKLDFDNNNRLTNTDLLKFLVQQAKATEIFKKDKDDGDYAQELTYLYNWFQPYFQDFDADGNEKWNYAEAAKFFNDSFDINLSNQFFGYIVTMFNSPNNQLTENQVLVFLLACVEYYELENETGSNKRIQLKNQKAKLAKFSYMDFNNDNKLNDADMFNFLVGTARTTKMLTKFVALMKRDDDSAELEDAYNKFQPLFNKYDEDADGEWEYSEMDAFCTAVLGVGMDQDYFSNLINIFESKDQFLTEKQSFIFYLAILTMGEYQHLGLQ